jgi:hypothetical protein
MVSVMGYKLIDPQINKADLVSLLPGLFIVVTRQPLPMSLSLWQHVDGRWQIEIRHASIDHKYRML